MLAISQIKLNPYLNNSQSQPKAGASYPNLAPLAKDTVSFTGAKDLTCRAGEITIALAKRVRAEAKPDFEYFTSKLKKIFHNHISNDSHPNRIILPGEDGMKLRLKSRDSIVEKANVLGLTTKDSIKAGFSDLIGGRIILKEGSRAQVDEIISTLSNAAKNGEIKIKEIENYRPDKKLSYCSPRVLSDLEKIGEKLTTDFSRRDVQIPSGYTALHLGIELPGKTRAELQIMGREVEKLKELEDVFYKIKQNKNIDKKYEPITNIIKDIRTNQHLVRAFDNHTREQYIYARKKELGLAKPLKTDFLPVPHYLPRNFGFNDLNNLRIKCEKGVT